MRGLSRAAVRLTIEGAFLALVAVGAVLAGFELIVIVALVAGAAVLVAVVERAYAREARSARRLLKRHRPRRSLRLATPRWWTPSPGPSRWRIPSRGRSRNSLSASAVHGRSSRAVRRRFTKPHGHSRRRSPNRRPSPSRCRTQGPRRSAMTCRTSGTSGTSAPRARPARRRPAGGVGSVIVSLRDPPETDRTLRASSTSWCATRSASCSPKRAQTSSSTPEPGFRPAPSSRR
jgi:hypothetical protein